MYAIEKRVPIPAVSKKSGRRPKYPFAQMKPGDSFAVPVRGPKAINTARRRLTVSACIAAKKYGAKFVTRSTPKAVRCWRVA